MRFIEHEVYTRLDSGKIGKHTVWDVAADSGYRVKSYETLQIVVAELAYQNPQFKLLFRGQKEDHREPYNRQSISALFPALWRLSSGTKRRAALCKLHKLTKRFRESLKRRDRQRLRDIDEKSWSTLQHYSWETKCETPLLDLTDNIRVAASFATQPYLPNDNLGSEGFVYVFGLPGIHQAVTISVDDTLIILRLQSVCPQSAAVTGKIDVREFAYQETA